MSTLGAGPNLVTDGMIMCVDAANVRCYPGSGTSITDLSLSETGTLADAPTFDSDFGGSFSFNGSSNYITMTEKTPQYMTLSCWFKATGAPSTNDGFGGVMIAANPQLNGTLAWMLGYSWTTNKVNFLLADNASYLASSTVSANEIHHAVATYDGSFQKIYVDGSSVGSRSWTTSATYPTSGDVNVRIGEWGYSGYQRNFNGNIYRCSIYNRALTEAEIVQNYNVLRGRFGL